MDELDRQLDTFLRRPPKLGEGVYLAQTAVVFGDVTIGEHSSVCFNSYVTSCWNNLANPPAATCSTPAFSARLFPMPRSPPGRDNLGSNSRTWVPVLVDVIGINDAPVISGNYTFTQTNEDTTGVAVQVSTLLRLSGTVTVGDDEGATIGIAVRGATASGQWQYALDATNNSNGTWTN